MQVTFHHMDRWETRTTTKSGRNWAPLGGSITDQDWELYVSDLAAGVMEFEISDACLYSTQTVRQGQRERIHFFDKAWGPDFSVAKTNMAIPAMLPNPQTFIIHRIRIFGIPNSMLLSAFEIQLGSKSYCRRPSWLCAIRGGAVLQPRMYMPPYVNFRASIEWDGGFECGTDIAGRQLDKREIQIALSGRIARPTQ